MDEFGDDSFVDTSNGGGSFGDDSFVSGDAGGGSFGVAQLGGLLGGAARSGGSLVGGFSRSAGRMVGRVGTIVTRSGQRISTTKAWEIAKRYGPDVAAAALGIAVADFFAIMMDSGAMTRRRRRRGISARDIRCASRVVRFVNRMQHQLGCVTRRSFGGGHRHRVTNIRARA